MSKLALKPEYTENMDKPLVNLFNTATFAVLDAILESGGLDAFIKQLDFSDFDGWMIEIMPHLANYLRSKELSYFEVSDWQDKMERNVRKVLLSGKKQFKTGNPRYD